MRGGGRDTTGRRGPTQPGPGLDQGAEFKVLGVRVVKKESTNFRVPLRLSEPGFRLPREAENADNPRVFRLSFRMMQWFLNDAQFEMEAVRANEIFKAGSLHVLEFTNTGSGMMQMPHPIHLHGGQFQVEKRFPGAGSMEMTTSLHEGFMDEGWKDTVLILPGERVRLLMQFPRFKGLFLYHCHTLEHEDMGMMRNYRLI